MIKRTIPIGIAAQRQALCDRVVDLHAVLLSQGVADVVWRALVEVHGDQLDPRREETFIERETFEELRQEHLAVGFGGGVKREGSVQPADSHVG